MSAPLTFGKNGFAIAEEVARLLRYESTDHFLRIRRELEAEGFPAPQKRRRRLLWEVSAIDAWLKGEREKAAKSADAEAGHEA